MQPSRLATKIAAEIRKGRMTFARFMERALYDAVDGYYTKPLPPDVRDRDYITSPDVSAVFGTCLAKQILQMWELLDRPADFQVVELGAGRGLLGLDVLSALEKLTTTPGPILTYIAVERSENRSRGLRERLSATPPPALAASARKVSWKPSLEEVSDGLTGVVFSNELFDALPVHRVCPAGDRMLEVYVRAAAPGGFREELDEPSTPAIAAYFERLGLKLPDASPAGRTEVNLAGERLMEDIGRKMERGFVVTVDYGYPAMELHAPHRVASGGTLMCYHRHRAHGDPYIRIGEQDLTAHVDFTALSLAGRSVGLEPLGFTDQLHFLMGLGIAEDIRPVPEGQEAIPAIQHNLAIKNLLLPGGLGGTLKVLIQSKGVPAKTGRRLLGLQQPVFHVDNLLHSGL